jgi:hypothetical protein
MDRQVIVEVRALVAEQGGDARIYRVPSAVIDDVEVNFQVSIVVREPGESRERDSLSRQREFNRRDCTCESLKGLESPIVVALDTR